MKDLALYFGLFFRMTFYTFFLSQIFFHKKIFTNKNRKLINIISLFFGICYISYFVPFLFDGHFYGGGIKTIIGVLFLFFLWLFFYINFLQSITFSLKQERVIQIVIIIIICFLNSYLNYYSYPGTWNSNPVSISCHGLLSFLVPLFALISKNSKPLKRDLGGLLIILTVIQFIYGVNLSFGTEGYLSDDIEFSFIFVSNTLFLLITGIFHVSKKTRYNFTLNLKNIKSPKYKTVVKNK